MDIQKQTGTVKEIANPVSLKEIRGEEKIEKVAIKIEIDNDQSFFLDVIGNKLKLLEGIEVGDYIEVSFTFRGSKKRGIGYNNLYCHDIKKL